MGNKNKFSLIILIASLIHFNNLMAQSCEDDPNTTSCEEPESTTLSDKEIKITAFCHFGGGINTNNIPFCPAIVGGVDISECLPPVGKKKIKSDPVFRVLRFDALFHESAEYDISFSGNQGDMNKLMRMYSMQCGKDQYYLSLGWRWRLDLDAVELALYSHIDHRDQDPCTDGHPGRVILPLRRFISKSSLTSIPGQTTFSGWNVEMVFSTFGYFVRAGNRGVAIRRNFTLENCPITTPAKTRVRKDAYFGGQECAPHDIRFDVRDIKVDHSPTWWSNSDYKGYFGSQFYSGETVVIYAKNTIDFGVNSLLNQPGYSKNIIHSGANVTLSVDAGGEIIADASNTGVECNIGAELTCFVGGGPTTNIDPAFSPIYTCPPPARWSGENEEDEEDNATIEYDTIFTNKNKNIEKHTITHPILAALPNPFKVNVIFEYKLEQDGPVELFVSNIQGQKIEALVNETNKPAGRHLYLYYASHLKPGIYLYTLKTKDNSITKRLVVLK